MKRRLPVELLNILIYWLDNCSSCTRWNGVFSQFFKLTFGVRQGSVLSPFLFAIYLVDIIDYCFNDMSSFIILYADNIVLLAQSVGELQHILSVCERELSWLDMNINSNKFCVITNWSSL